MRRNKTSPYFIFRIVKMIFLNPKLLLRLRVFSLRHANKTNCNCYNSCFLPGEHADCKGTNRPY